ncbi:MAG: hypothetical protein WC789_11330 [Lentisphaeria bacterium]|jgi:tetratricopeptide (TPR) repeat protein
MTPQQPFSRRGLALLAAATLALLAFAPRALAKDAALEKADQLRAQRQYDAALDAYDTLLKKPQLPLETQVGCLWGIVDGKRQQKKPADALAAIDRLLAILPANDDGRRTAREIRHYLLRHDLNRPADAGQFADACAAALAADDPGPAATWSWQAATDWLAAKRYPEATAAAARTAEAARQAQNWRSVADSLWLASDIALYANDLEKAITPLRQLLDLVKDGDLAIDFQFRAQARLGDCLVKLNRLPEARQAYETFIATEPSAEIRQRWWLAIAQSWQTEKNAPAALDALAKVVTAQAGTTGYAHWVDAQWQSIDLLLQAGNLPAALETARGCFDIADTRERIIISGNRIVGILQQLDKKSDRATLFLDFQRFGPAGKDGTPGTADDLTNPLDAIPRIADPVREQAFAAAEATLGTDVEALIQRGLMRTWRGQKKEACAILLEACRRAAGDQVAPAANALIFVGVRGVRGHVADLDTFVPFLAYGPAGADGNSSLPDPFAALALPPPGLPPAAAAEAEGLRDLRRRLEHLQEDRYWPGNGRGDAATALLRVHGALADWNEKEVLAWYLARIAAEKTEHVPEPLLQGLLAAARQGRVDWGETRRFLAAAAATLPPPQAATLAKFAKSPRNPLPALEKLEAAAKPDAIFRR